MEREWEEFRGRGKLDVRQGDITSQRHVNGLFRDRVGDREVGSGSGSESGAGAGGIHSKPIDGTEIVGVVHLAAVSRRQWCEERQEECERVNVEGTRLLLETMQKHKHGYKLKNKKTQKQKQTQMEKDGSSRSQDDNFHAGVDDDVPWILYVSSMDVHGISTQLGDTDDATALGRTQRAAEAMVRDYPGRRIIVRPSSVYGDPQDIQDRLFPSFVRHALTDMPIQVMNGNDRFDFLHMDDAITGISSAVNRLSDHAGAAEEEYDLVSGYTATSHELLDMVRGLTNSAAPIQDYTEKITRNSQGITVSKAPSQSLVDNLGFKATIKLTDGLVGYLAESRTRFIIWSQQYIDRECPQSVFGNPKVVPEADLRNRHVDRLQGCTVTIGVHHDGWMHHLKCGERDGVGCSADNMKRPGFNWNQSVFTIERVMDETPRPPAGKIPSGRGWFGGDQSNDFEPQRITVRFIEEITNRTLGFQRKSTSRSGKARRIKLKLFDQNEEVDPTTLGVHTTFHPVIAPNSSALQLLVAGTNERVQVTTVVDGNKFETIRRTKNDPYEFRMTVLCCPTSEPWPLLLDDHEDADIRYGSTGDIPFAASKRHYECARVESAMKRALVIPQPEVESSNDLAAQAPMRLLPLSKRPDNWVNKNMLTCMNDCSNPLICVKTDHCRCIHAAECPIRRISPLLPRWTKSPNSIIKITTQEDFVEASRKKDWKDVLLPQAARVINEFPDLMKVHVVSGYPGEAEIEAAPCHKLAETHCFSADSIAYRALRQVSVPADEAELIVVPVYQHCDGAPFQLHDVLKYASDTIPNLNNRPIALYMTHDWGICREFAWNIWDARTNNHLYPDWILRDIFVWQPMGDAYSKCYRPHQDIVVPPRTCLSNKLRESFSDIYNVKPATQRPYLVTWSGTQWGTGKSARLRLTCDRGGAGRKELIPGAGPQSRWFHWIYMKELQNARFCPQPTGVAGWSFRVQDAIYAGCIPILMSDGTHFPYADVLDWTRFSIRVSPTELDHLEDILLAIPAEQVEELQANLMAVREAFLYASDESPEDELSRKGPLYFAMQSARMRTRTTYPMIEQES